MGGAEHLVVGRQREAAVHVRDAHRRGVGERELGRHRARVVACSTADLVLELEPVQERLLGVERQPVAVIVDRRGDLGGVRGEHERRELRDARVERKLRPHRLPVLGVEVGDLRAVRGRRGAVRGTVGRARGRSAGRAGRAGRRRAAVLVAGGQPAGGQAGEAGAEEGTASGCWHSLIVGAAREADKGFALRRGCRPSRATSRRPATRWCAGSRGCGSRGPRSGC